MPVAFHNFQFSYENEKGKPIFVPSDEGRAIGKQIKALVEAGYEFDPFYRHFAAGGHVGALHAHRHHSGFARVDLKNFFYSIERSRVQRALRACGVKRHQYFAKWSTVKNPYVGAGYVLPYGFVQSPILASLVLSRSPLGDVLRAISDDVTVTVYLDDIAISSDDPERLSSCFDRIMATIEPAGFEVNGAKVAAPAADMTLFNCEVSTGRIAVSDERRTEFYSLPRSPESADAFERYCASVAEGNTPAEPT
jgi:hypothetical protein